MFQKPIETETQVDTISTQIHDRSISYFWYRHFNKIWRG